ncbi:family 1 glycosylhydrolase [Promineifilum sp.]|uniref:family 1 glycosylhydrolase n=1 Tax=Promineifilum sp. TaxID=2664178 RepID=UPI0035B3778E
MDQSDTFLWAVGIEDTFIPQEQPGLRALEEYELTQHYQLWSADIDRAADLGVSHIRWGIPWYRVNPEPGRYEWGWVDEVLDYLVNQKGIQPIVDLMHYGTPLWLERSFLDPDYPRHVADYARAVAERYGQLVRYYTPLNEPTVNAEFCGRRGEWPPYREGETGYVAVLMALLRGMVLAAQAIREADPDAAFVQVEALGWHWTHDERLHAEVARRAAHSYLAFDLFTGQVDTAHSLWPYLRDHGVAEEDLSWLRERAARVEVLGVNLYPWSGGELVMDADGQAHCHGELTGHHLAGVLRQAWARYHIPLMVTETSARRDVAGRARWMDETLAAVAAVRAEGIPVIGYTWFPMMTMIDWEYRSTTQPLEDYLLHLGLWDSAFDEDGVLQRHATPLVEKYRQYVKLGIRN